MSDNKGSGLGPIPSNTGRKRGHQHHIRNSGQRRSNVPADEVIAALRSGSDLLMARTHHHDDDDQSKRQSFIDDDDVIMIDIDNNTTINSNITTDINANTRSILSEFSTNNKSATKNNKSNNNGSMNSSKTKVTGSSDAGTSQLSTAPRSTAPTATTSDSSRNLIKKTSALNDKNNNLQMDTPKEHLMLDQVGLADSVSSGSSSTNIPGNNSSTPKSKKSKSKREGGSSKKSSKSSSSTDSTKKERRTKRTIMPPNEERPPLEGAPANELYEGDVGDIENDPEAAEWSKLRCTSDSTEVVAEREYRRQNRRCADYPGLAFGRSIFSSDTMMKLNIIRNELHNIMKTQLKRVGCGCGKKNKLKKSNESVSAMMIDVF